MTISDYIREHYSNRRSISLDRIILTERIHQRGSANNLLPYNENRTLIVQDLHNGKYALVSGWNTYQQAKIMGIISVNCLITELSRKEFTTFIGESYRKVKNIRVPRQFCKTMPSAEKVKKAKENAENGIIRPITISKDGYVIDGFSRYLAAKELGIKSIPVNHSGWSIGKHGGALPPKPFSRKSI